MQPLSRCVWQRKDASEDGWGGCRSGDEVFGVGSVTGFVGAFVEDGS
jgi:hypothetical protein